MQTGLSAIAEAFNNGQKEGKMFVTNAVASQIRKEIDLANTEILNLDSKVKELESQALIIANPKRIQQLKGHIIQLKFEMTKLGGRREAFLYTIECFKNIHGITETKN